MFQLGNTKILKYTLYMDESMDMDMDMDENLDKDMDVSLDMGMDVSLDMGMDESLDMGMKKCLCLFTELFFMNWFYVPVREYSNIKLKYIFTWPRAWTWT
jgi:hypothetical protein